MATAKQYSTRLGVGTALGIWAAVIAFGFSSVAVGKETIAAWLIMSGWFGLGSLAFGLLIALCLRDTFKDVDFFEPNGERGQKTLRGLWFLIPICVVQIFHFLEKGESVQQIIVRLTFVVLGMGMMALALWLTWGKWLNEGIAARRQLASKQTQE